MIPYCTTCDIGQLSQYSLEFCHHRPSWIPATFPVLHCSLPLHDLPLSTTDHTLIAIAHSTLLGVSYFKLVLQDLFIRCEIFTTACKSNKINKELVTNGEHTILRCYHSHVYMHTLPPTLFHSFTFLTLSAFQTYQAVPVLCTYSQL